MITVLILAAYTLVACGAPSPPVTKSMPDVGAVPSATAPGTGAERPSQSPTGTTPGGTNPPPTPGTPGGPRRLSGMFAGNQEWSGEIIVTGDVMVMGNLRIQPGTIVRFLVQDDQGTGQELPPDGHNDRDPTRLASYAITHAALMVGGRLDATGTAAQPITFTSASAQPRLADWQGIGFRGDGSVLDHVVVEWTRNGIAPGGSQPRSVIRNSIVRHSMWGCISANPGEQILDNDLSDCGHEGIDIKGGAAIIRGNLIHDSYSAIAVLEGSHTIEGNTVTNCGDGIGVKPGATPKVGQNSITLAIPGTKMEWRYGDFAYRMFEKP